MKILWRGEAGRKGTFFEGVEGWGVALEPLVRALSSLTKIEIRVENKENLVKSSRFKFVLLPGLLAERQPFLQKHSVSPRRPHTAAALLPHLLTSRTSSFNMPPAWAALPAPDVQEAALRQSVVLGGGRVVITSTQLSYFCLNYLQGKEAVGREGSRGSVLSPTRIDSTRSEKSKPVKKKNHFLFFLSFLSLP